MTMSNQIHWRSAHDSFTKDDPTKDGKTYDVIRRKVMAFTKAETLSLLKVMLPIALTSCDEYIWPYSAYLRWRVKAGYRKRVKEIERITDKWGWN